MRFNLTNMLSGQKRPTSIILLCIIIIFSSWSVLFTKTSPKSHNTAPIMHKEKIVIVITGSNGLLGTIAAKALKDPDLEKKIANTPIEVIGIDLSNTQSKPSPRMLMDGLNIRPNEFKNPIQKQYVADITNVKQLSNVFQQIKKDTNHIDIVIHFAGILEDQSPEKIENVNVYGTKNIYQICTGMGIKKIVLASSVTTAYDLFFKKKTKEIKPEIRKVEDIDWDIIKNSLQAYNPDANFKSLSTYIKSKIKNEQEADKRMRENGIETVIARIGWVNSKNSIKNIAESGEFCSRADFIRFIVASVKYLLTETTNKPKNPTLYVVSHGTKYSPQNQIGFEPKDQAKDFVKSTVETPADS